MDESSKIALRNLVIDAVKTAEKDNWKERLKIGILITASIIAISIFAVII